MKSPKHLLKLPIAVVGLTLVAAGCGDDDDSQTVVGGSATVNVNETEQFEEILVDADGNALYIVEEELDGPMRCVEQCLDAWPPLLTEDDPTTSGDVTADVGTVERDDGTVQVTLDGAPLYAFASDPAPGDVTGHGVTGDVNGATVTWRVATPSGEPPEPADSDDDGGGYGY